MEDLKTAVHNRKGTFRFKGLLSRSGPGRVYLEGPARRGGSAALWTRLGVWRRVRGYFLVGVAIGTTVFSENAELNTSMWC